jgi:hypothetical protein
MGLRRWPENTGDPNGGDGGATLPNGALEIPQRMADRVIHDPNGIRTRVTAVKGRTITERICLGANLVPNFGHYEKERMAPD